MINYPKNYAPLAEEEMEYTSGGLSINWMALGSTVIFLDLRFLAMIVHYHVIQAALKIPPASAAVPINIPAAVL